MKEPGCYLGRALTGLWSRGGRNRRLAVLIYHRVLTNADPLHPREPDLDTFRWQMAAVAATCNVLPLTEAVERLASHSLPPRAVAIIFDDGYADNLTQALPVLYEFDLPATVFVASGFIGGGIMWNDMVIETLRRAPAGEIDLSPVDLEPARVDGVGTRCSLVQAVIDRLKYLPLDERKQRAAELADHLSVDLLDDLMLTASQLKILAAGGVEIGAHTVNHPILSRLSVEQARKEIIDSRANLEDLLHSRWGCLRIPMGKQVRTMAMSMLKCCALRGLLRLSQRRGQSMVRPVTAISWRASTAGIIKRHFGSLCALRMPFGGACWQISQIRDNGLLDNY